MQIAGSKTKPVQPYLIAPKMERLLQDLTQSKAHVVLKLAKFHLDFEGIHPFIDGNERTGRLLVNLELMKAAFPPIDIKFADRASYCDAFDSYFADGDPHARKELFAKYTDERLENYLADASCPALIGRTGFALCSKRRYTEDRAQTEVKMEVRNATFKNLIAGLDKVFVIPPFQRNYEWTDEECGELFSDILKVCQTNESHYLGNVVYYIGKNTGSTYTELVLIDGQQRITSLLLLVCAIRDSLPQKDVKEKERIERHYLTNDSDEKRFRMRLKQNEYDAGAFEAIIDQSEISKEQRESNVYKNYQYFKELLEENTQIDKMRILDAIANLEIVDLNLQISSDLTTIQIIFEKMNSTGKPLSLADLIRNYLLVCETTEEQIKLYKDYWIKIERNLDVEKISAFVKDYLIMKTYKDVNNKKAYQTFKEYADASGKTKKEILADLFEYSKYYKYILSSDECPNGKLRRPMKMLVALKTGDVYPLYMFLLKRLAKDEEMSVKVFTLLKDFLLRYRIVSPATGSGELRGVVQKLLQKIDDGQIKCSYDAILFELSNSTAEGGRFPDDDEFKEALKKSSLVNYTYGKVLFLTIEENETKNIPVSFDKVTIEHLMPQTLSPKWIEDLGGKENASRIYDMYINCIGNLAPLSQGYNAKISNNVWSKKRADLKKAQFNITTEATENTIWTEDQIKARNEDLADRACKAVASPKERTRSTRSPVARSGTYPANISTTNGFTGTKIVSICINEQTIKVPSWNKYFAAICGAVYKKDTSTFETLVAENKIHKSKSKQTIGPLISQDKTLLEKPMAMAENPAYFYESCLSAIAAIKHGARLLKEFGLLSKTTFTIKGSDDDEDDEE